MKADELKDKNLRRSGFVPLPVWRQKVKKHVKRKANISEPSGDKRWKIEESSLDLEKSSPVTPSFISSEMARVQANFKFDHVLQEMKHYTVFFCMVTNCSLLCTRISWIEIRSR